MKTCPYEVIGGGIGELFRFADLQKQGMPPISGGALDQTNFFLDCLAFIHNEEARSQAEAFSK